MLRNRLIDAILLLSSSVAYVLIFYFLERHETFWLALCFVTLCISFFFLIKNYKPEKLIIFLVAAALFRLLSISSSPTLSEDIYRYIWDAYLSVENINPYETPPSQWANYDAFTQELYPELNSKEYYSVYPPVAQWLFSLSIPAVFKSVKTSVIIFRIFILLFEGLAIWLMWMLLKARRLPIKNLFIYALNPLAIIEIAGNLHFEGIIILLVLLAVGLLNLGKPSASGVTLALAIGLKLSPILYLPIFIQRLNWRRLLVFVLSVIAVLFIIVLPFYSVEALLGFTESLSLFFKTFEFNASFYYLFRWWDYQYLGYNNISENGPLMLVITIFSLITYLIIDRVKKPEIFISLMFISGIYLFFSTTVHPWYILPLLAYSVFGKYRWPLLWSFLILPTYFGYYDGGFDELEIWVAIEYALVILYMSWEVLNPKKRFLLGKYV